ncbi:MAG: cation diffusion facilitator family transporter [Pseudomonadota bacterium]
MSGHHHHDHAGGHGEDARRRVAAAAILTFLFMIAEVIGGVISGSLALLADAAHMLTDAGALGLAWLGYKLAERPADETRSYGFDRLRILAAFTNGVALIALAIWIVAEAVQRLFAPQPVMGGVLLGVAIAGLLVNLIAFAILHRGSSHDLNLQGALWHVAGDLLGSLAAILAAVVILTTGWTAIDPLLSLLVAGLVAFGGVGIARRSGHILLQAAPRGLSSDKIAADLMAHVSGLAAVGHIHAWAHTETRPMVTLEARAAAGACPETLRLAVKRRLAEAFDVSHATVEVESERLDATREGVKR